MSCGRLGKIFASFFKSIKDGTAIEEKGMYSVILIRELKCLILKIILKI